MQFNFIVRIQCLSTANALYRQINVSMFRHMRFETLNVYQMGRTICTFATNTDPRMAQFVFGQNIRRWENIVTNQTFVFAARMSHFHVIFQIVPVAPKKKHKQTNFKKIPNLRKS